MIPAEKAPVIEVRQPDGSFVVAHLEQLQSGDVFRVKHPHASGADLKQENTLWRVNKNGVHVFCDEVK